jgi:hypothetical protein
MISGWLEASFFLAMAGIIFNGGIIWNKVSTLREDHKTLEERVTNLEAIKTVMLKFDMIEKELARINERLDKLFEVKGEK